MTTRDDPLRPDGPGPADRQDPTDPASWDHLFRRRFWRAAGGSAVWLLVIVAAVTAITLQENSSAWLLDHGTPVAGEVVDVRTPARGEQTITVDYPVGDVLDQAVIGLDSDRDYTVGERVRVFYDPADPDHVRTADEENLSEVGVGFAVVPMLIALLLLPWSIAYAVGWARRRRAAKRSGWRPVTAVVFDSSGGHQVLRLDFPDGAFLIARTVAAVRGRYSFLRAGAFGAWVAGEGRRRALALWHPAKGAYVVPLRAPRRARRRTGR
ncbi:DUF3592 domain-containing protein [Amycolatopsis rhabdoformis]|uniref:DUF3592 domain-containing protein n=1 Tax=Amycolatopsis rhabdoformis TaxID=1448059 RepID=A0ABZ1I9M5_9PSEU|nr:DUF3592 domain-containing protein [Amycolatopsis rhabdoformis]WSE30648.1 DUF3592 domain-containing protein [Amycolatopsis rhabdoformis]